MLQAWVIWNLCNLESKIISVERIFQYSNIDSEPPLFIEENRPDASWPSNGEIELLDLQVTLNEYRYYYCLFFFHLCDNGLYVSHT